MCQRQIHSRVPRAVALVNCALRRRGAVAEPVFASTFSYTCETRWCRRDHGAGAISEACHSQVYNNNFIGEQNAPGRKGSGVTTDYDTPRKHLREAMAALDEILGFGV